MARFKIPEVLSPSEQSALISTMQELIGTSSERNLIMVKIMLEAGLRSAEVLSLRHRDVDLTDGGLMVRDGKNGKDRQLWVNPALLALIKTFIEGKGESKGDDYLFTTRTGKPLVTRYLRYIVASLAKKAGIDKHVHPHTLRHSFASSLFSATKNLVLVQKALGHKSIETTTIYTHISNPELEAAMKEIR